MGEAMYKRVTALTAVVGLAVTGTTVDPSSVELTLATGNPC
jgi:hypothetical protein